MPSEPSFWSAVASWITSWNWSPQSVIALLAVLLSQLRPLHDIFTRAKVRLVSPELIRMKNAWGMLSLRFFVDLHNSGRKSAFIDRLVCLVVLPGGDTLALRGRLYASRDNAFSLQLGGITLEPGEGWAEMVTFFDLRPEDEEGTLKALMQDALKIAEESQARYMQFLATPEGQALRAQAVQTGVMPDIPKPADLRAREELIGSRVATFFEGTRKFSRGRLRIHIVALSQGRRIVTQSFESTLFESDIDELNRMPGFFGHGLSAQLPESTGPQAPKEIPIRLVSVRDSQATKREIDGLMA